ncbi:hypothetical protein [Parabacteroides sp. PF5-6]|uniref:hypothetical protein n=1 Tax=Parabacteroides sp. PF5-6 TaxID=1742403 RepID=UPI0024076B1D|nr:hypothetical protein [Parabacteroides sp. PF5-6]MDF9828994.1 hypothetical protein [Parabacteroides sp. PF5-6]
MKTFLPRKKMLWLIALLCSVSMYGQTQFELSNLEPGYSVCIRAENNKTYLIAYKTTVGIDNGQQIYKEFDSSDLFLRIEFDNLDIDSYVGNELVLTMEEGVKLNNLTVKPAVPAVTINMRGVEIANALKINEKAKVALEIAQASGTTDEPGLKVKRVEVDGELICEPVMAAQFEDLGSDRLLKITEALSVNEKATLKDWTGAIQQATVGTKVLKKRAWTETMLPAEDGKYIALLYSPLLAQPAGLPAEQINMKKKNTGEGEDWLELTNQLLQELNEPDNKGLKLQAENGKGVEAGEYRIETQIGNVLFTHYLAVKGNDLPARLKELEEKETPAEKIVITNNNRLKLVEGGDEIPFNGIIPGLTINTIEIASPTIVNGGEQEKREITLLDTDITNLIVEKNVDLTLIQQNLNRIKTITIAEDSKVKIVPQTPEKAKPTGTELGTTAKEEIRNGIIQAEPQVKEETIQDILKTLNLIKNTGGLNTNGLTPGEDEIETAVIVNERASFTDETGRATEVAGPNPTDPPNPLDFFKQLPGFPPIFPKPGNTTNTPANSANMPASMPEDQEKLEQIKHDLKKVNEDTGQLEDVPVGGGAYSGIQRFKNPFSRAESGNELEDYTLSFTPPGAGFYRIQTTIKKAVGEIVVTSPLFVVIPTANSVYHIINLETGGSITANYSAGELTIEEGEHLYLQFNTEEPVTADELLFTIDGKEETLRELGNNTFSYIINPITKDSEVLIALREYKLTIPEVPGAVSNPLPGTYSLPYGDPFRLTLSTLNEHDPSDVHVFLNGVEWLPENALRATEWSFLLDRVTDHQVITVEGVNATGNALIDTTPIDLYVSDGALVAETPLATRLSIYTPAGKLYATRQLTAGTTTVPLPAGMYIVQIGNKVAKVVIP